MKNSNNYGRETDGPAPRNRFRNACTVQYHDDFILVRRCFPTLFTRSPHSTATSNWIRRGRRSLTNPLNASTIVAKYHHHRHRRRRHHIIIIIIIIIPYFKTSSIVYKFVFLTLYFHWSSIVQWSVYCIRTPRRNIFTFVFVIENTLP